MIFSFPSLGTAQRHGSRKQTNKQRGGWGKGESEAPLSLFSSLFFLALFLRAVLHYPKPCNRLFFSLHSFLLITLLPRFASSQSDNFICLNNNTFLKYQITTADMEKKRVLNTSKDKAFKKLSKMTESKS